MRNIKSVKNFFKKHKITLALILGVKMLHIMILSGFSLGINVTGFWESCQLHTRINI